jgi:squalene synthase HpnC
VGSFLLPRRLRPHVATFYACARAIDDIADNPALAPEEKIARLSAFEEALLGRRDDPGLEKAHRMRVSLAATGVTPRHCQDLISAFKQDAVKLRYANWAELMDYCDRSASPVGRYLLDLHGEVPSDYPPCDALCNALQVINHLQDCGLDYQSLDRVYLPLDWMAVEGTSVEALNEAAASPALRRVLDRCLDGVEALLAQARHAPARLKNKRLAFETGAIVALAEKLTQRLRAQDPLARRVVLAKPELALVCARGVGRTLLARAKAA